MNLSWLDPYQERGSRVHALDARLKLVIALSLIVAINLTPVQAWPAHLLYLLMTFAVIALARLTGRSVLGRALLATPFVLIAAVGVPFVREGTPVVSLPLFSTQLTLTNVGLLRLANVLIKSWLSVLVAITLVLTTPFWIWCAPCAAWACRWS